MNDIRAAGTYRLGDRELEDVPLTEPEIIPLLYVRGCELEVVDSVVQARNLQTALKKALAQGGH